MFLDDIDERHEGYGAGWFYGWGGGNGQGEGDPDDYSDHTGTYFGCGNLDYGGHSEGDGGQFYDECNCGDGYGWYGTQDGDGGGDPNNVRVG